MQNFDITQLEAIAADMASDLASERERLFRLVRTCANIVALQANAKGEKFGARYATRHGDEAGHFDNSFPPAQEFSEFTGPRLVLVRDWQTEDVATSGGFYYSWDRVTTDPGAFVDQYGQFWGADETGSGRRGQFAAYPGDCDVNCQIEWEELSASEVSTQDLRDAFMALGALAFPLATAALEAKKEAK